MENADNLVPRRTIASNIARYCEEVIKWNASINLISRGDSTNASSLMARHMADSAQILDHIPLCSTLLDIGSGSGLPGVVLAIHGVSDVILIEPDHKKCAFLRCVATHLREVHYRVETCRMEDYVHGGVVDIIVSRAFSSCANIVAGCWHNISRNTKVILFKSRAQIDLEIKKMGELYLFDLQVIPSRISNDSVIMIVSSIVLK